MVPDGELAAFPKSGYPHGIVHLAVGIPKGLQSDDRKLGHDQVYVENKQEYRE